MTSANKENSHPEPELPKSNHQHRPICRQTKTMRTNCLSLSYLMLILVSTSPIVHGLWFINSNLTSHLVSIGRAAAPSLGLTNMPVQGGDLKELDTKELEQKEAHRQDQSELLGEHIETAGQQQVVGQSPAGAGASGYGSNLLSIAGIRPSSIASLLNAVGDTGFRYFNIEDQCRNRAACDLGFMLYKKLSFVHNWLIRTSVRSLTDMNNMYTQSWMEGMLGRNCTTVYLTCRQSPLEGLMSMGFLQQLAIPQV